MILWILTCLLTGCAADRLMSHNMAAGHDLALLFKMNDNSDSDPKYPKNLVSLQSNLKSAGVETPLPRCKAPDGNLMDFIYIPGLHGSDGRDWAFLFSPLEVNSNKVLVVCLDASLKVLSREKAAREMDRTRAFVRTRENECRTSRCDGACLARQGQIQPARATENKPTDLSVGSKSWR